MIAVSTGSNQYFYVLVSNVKSNLLGDFAIVCCVPYFHRVSNLHLKVPNM